MTFNLKEHRDAKKFIKKHEKDKKLILRIYERYDEILNNPYHVKFRQLKSVKCPKCQRAKVGDYRIVFYIIKEKNLVEIIDIFHRNEDYRYY